MTETPLIIIELSPRQNIGYTVKGGEMQERIIATYRSEIRSALLELVDRLDAPQYPFGFLPDTAHDLCECGDYRKEHTDGGACLLNGLGHHGAPNCEQFRLA